MTIDEALEVLLDEVHNEPCTQPDCIEAREAFHNSRFGEAVLTNVRNLSAKLLLSAVMPTSAQRTIDSVKCAQDALLTDVAQSFIVCYRIGRLVEREKLMREAVGITEASDGE